MYIVFAFCGYLFIIAGIIQKQEMFFTIIATCLHFMAFIKTVMRLLNS